MDELPPDDGDPMLHEQLVQRAQAGDERAFTILFTCYSPGLCLYLRGMARCSEDGDDLAQETFIKAWEKLWQLEDELKFKPWLYRIATNIIYDYWRRQKSQGHLRQISLEQHLEGCEDHQDPRCFEEHVVERELAKQALSEVPLKECQCLLLEIEGKLPRQEIAEVVGISLSSVSVYISKAREHFRKAHRRLSSGGGHSHA